MPPPPQQPSWKQGRVLLVNSMFSELQSSTPRTQSRPDFNGLCIMHVFKAVRDSPSNGGCWGGVIPTAGAARSDQCSRDVGVMLHCGAQHPARTLQPSPQCTQELSPCGHCGHELGAPRRCWEPDKGNTNTATHQRVLGGSSLSPCSRDKCRAWCHSEQLALEGCTVPTRPHSSTQSLGSSHRSPPGPHSPTRKAALDGQSQKC